MTFAENDATFRALATRLLAKFGAPSTYEQRTGGTYDRTTGEVTGSTLGTPVSVLASPPVPRDQVFRTTDTLQEAATIIILAAPDIALTPRAGDYIEQSGQRYAVTAVQTYRSGAQAAAYFLGVEATA